VSQLLYSPYQAGISLDSVGLGLVSPPHRPEISVSTVSRRGVHS